MGRLHGDVPATRGCQELQHVPPELCCSVQPTRSWLKSWRAGTQGLGPEQVLQEQNCGGADMPEGRRGEKRRGAEGEERRGASL